MIPFSAILIPLFLIVRNFGWIDSYRGLIIPAIPHAFGIFSFEAVLISDFLENWKKRQ